MKRGGRSPEPGSMTRLRLFPGVVLAVPIAAGCMVMPDFHYKREVDAMTDRVASEYVFQWAFATEDDRTGGVIHVECRDGAPAPWLSLGGRIEVADVRRVTVRYGDAPPVEPRGWAVVPGRGGPELHPRGAAAAEFLDRLGRERRVTVRTEGPDAFGEPRTITVPFGTRGFRRAMGKLSCARQREKSITQR